LKVRKKAQAPNNGDWSSTLSTATLPIFFLFLSLPFFLILLLCLGLQEHLATPPFPFLLVASCYNFNKRGKHNKDLFSLPFLAPLLQLQLHHQQQRLTMGTHHAYFSLQIGTDGQAMAMVALTTTITTIHVNKIEKK
jgi:hypothetical protein